MFISLLYHESLPRLVGGDEEENIEDEEDNHHKHEEDQPASNTGCCCCQPDKGHELPAALHRDVEEGGHQEPELVRHAEQLGLGLVEAVQQEAVHDQAEDVDKDVPVVQRHHPQHPEHRSYFIHKPLHSAEAATPVWQVWQLPYLGF